MKSIPLLLRPSAFIVAAADAGCGPDALNNQLSTIYDHKPQTRNKHRGSSFREFLREDGILEEVQALALKRAVALKVYDLMKKQKLRKSALAAEMRTSRAAIHRLLDPQNTSVTLATLNRAARSLGQKVKIELVAA